MLIYRNVFKSLFSIAISFACALNAADVSNASTLENAIINANNGTDTTINFTKSFFYEHPFFPLNSTDIFTPTTENITINGNGNGLARVGATPARGFYVRGGAGSVIINNLQIQSAHAKGGDGGSGGGGGLGAGGGIFIEKDAVVTLINVSFTNTKAQGGSGGSGGIGSGGGGGMNARSSGGSLTIQENQIDNHPSQAGTFGGGGGGGFNSAGGNVGGFIHCGGAGGGGFNGDGSSSTGVIPHYSGAGGGGGGFDGGRPGLVGGGGGSGNAGHGISGTDGILAPAGDGGIGSASAGGAGGTSGLPLLPTGLGGGGGGGAGGVNGGAGAGGGIGQDATILGGGDGGDGGAGPGGGGGGGAGGFSANNLPSGKGGNGGAGGPGFGGGGGGASSSIIPELISTFIVPNLSGNGGNGGDPCGGGGGGASNYDQTLSPPSGGDGGYGSGGGGGGSGYGLYDSFVEGGPGGNGGSFGGGGGGGGGSLSPDATSDQFPTHTPGKGGNGGSGGFGAGGGGGGASIEMFTNPPTVVIPGFGGAGGFGGGHGAHGGLSGGAGGNGAGFGGAIFLQADAGNGASLTIQDFIAFEGNEVEGGGLPKQKGQALGRDIFMMSSSSITFELKSPSLIPNPLESDFGAGGGGLLTGGVILNASNTAPLTLIGNNTYTGETTIIDGALFVTGDSIFFGGSLITPVTLNGGDFGGVVTLLEHPGLPNSGFLRVNSGNINPSGNGYTPLGFDQLSGTVNVSQDLVFNGGGYLSQLASPVNDLIHVSKTATLGPGTLTVTSYPGNYLQGEIFTILEADGGILSQFGTINLQSSLNLSVIHTPLAVQVHINESSLFVHQAIESGNPAHVVEYIASLNPADVINSPLLFPVQILGLLSDEAVNKALNLMHPAGFGSLEWINMTNNSQVLETFSRHRLELSCSPRGCGPNEDGEKRNNLWIHPFGIWNDQPHLGELRGMTAQSTGVVMGYDRCFNHFYVGIGAGYTHSRFHWKGNAGRGDIDQYYGGIYGSYSIPYLTVDASSMLGKNFYNTERKIFYSTSLVPDGTINETARGHFAGMEWSSHLGFTVAGTPPIQRGNSSFSPLQVVGGVDYFYLHQRRFSESGAAGLNLDVREKVSNMLRSTIGLLGTYEFTIRNGCWAPYIGVSYVAKTPLSSSSYRSSFRGQDGTFSVNTTSKGVNLIAPSVGFKITKSQGLSILIDGRAELNGDYSAYFGDLRLDFAF